MGAVATVLMASDNKAPPKALSGIIAIPQLTPRPPPFSAMNSRRPKYAFKKEDGIIQAPARTHIIEGGAPSVALLAQIAVSKYADGLPLYRQEAIYARDKVDLDRAQCGEGRSDRGLFSPGSRRRAGHGSSEDFELFLKKASDVLRFGFGDREVATMVANLRRLLCSASRPVLR
jgi:Transposase IS66 family